MNSLADNLKALGRGRLIALGIVGAVIVLTMVIGLNVVTKPVYSTLYSGLSASEASGVVRSLEQAGIQVEVSPDGSVVSIPSGDFAKARMTLAENGLPTAGAPGWELFDTSGTSINSEQQRVNKLRAIQGELARTIQTIEGIDEARVHVVLPEREAFSRERPTPTASVLIRTSASFAFEKKHAISIRHLVSSAVQNLAANKVTIMTADGKVLLSEDSEGVVTDSGIEGKKAAHEDRFQRAIKNILSARVGAENVRVTVSVDLTSERKVVVSESFDPDQQVVRSTEVKSENEEAQDGSTDNVSVANNLPEAFANNGAADAGARSLRQKNEEVINYEIGSTKSETVYEPGQVEKVSVAVAVNGIYAEQADGEMSYSERSSDELAQLEDLVKAAIGYQEDRGDTISVQSFQFREGPLDFGEASSAGVGNFFEKNGLTIIKWALASLIIALFFIFGIRPMITAIVPQSSPEDDYATEDGETTDAPIEEQNQKSNILEAIDADAQQEDELIDISSVKGGVRKRRVAVVVDMVKQDQQEAVKILKTWAAQGA